MHCGKRATALQMRQKRGEIYKEIQNTINDNMYIYPIAYSNGFYAVSKDFGGFDECLLKSYLL